VCEENEWLSDAIARLANQMSVELRREIYRPLRAGANEFRINRELDSFDRGFAELKTALEKMGRGLPNGVDWAAQRARDDYRTLEWSLETDHGPLGDVQVDGRVALVAPVAVAVRAAVVPVDLAHARKFCDATGQEKSGPVFFAIGPL
jgi:hypothetical protein